MTEYHGWLLDIHPHPQQGVSLWLLGDDGERRQFHQFFSITFYAAGKAQHLRALWRYLKNQPVQMKLFRTARRDIFAGKRIPVLGISVLRAPEQPRLFYKIASAFPHLTLFDTDIHLSLRHAAAFGTFPLARCRLDADENLCIHDLQVLDSAWDLDPPPPPLRILVLEPDEDPNRKPPKYLLVHATSHGGHIERSYRLSLEQGRPLMINLRSILRRHDPDLLLTAWGDTWLLPLLLDTARHTGITLPLNRAERHDVAYRAERSYFSYGQIVYRGQQVHLYGRWHIDRGNAMLWDDYQVEGVLEMARVTALPVQTAARVSPGTGVSAMQMVTALRHKILVPWHKQQAENPRSALQMFAADQGGFVYQPVTGLHHHVAQIDFVSMYPGIMVHFNISPETVHARLPQPDALAPLRLSESTEERGLIPNTLAPLLNKRVALKNQLLCLSRWDPKKKIFKARASAHKWLLVTCFGYMGYKNARFGRIEAHEAVTAYGREALLRAKETAEDMGFRVLHMYVDGLWVQKEGAKQAADLQLLLDAIAERTGLPIALDGVYRWVAFLPSRMDPRLPVPNRYFGVFQDGSLRVRGIEARRRDTPQFIADVQMRILELLAKDETQTESAIALIRSALRALRSGRVPLEALVLTQKLSREVGAYKTPSPAARAAAQLQQAGKHLRPGQRVRFIYTLGDPGVHAWDLPDAPARASIDVSKYATLLIRAASNVLLPFGIDETQISRLVTSIPAKQLPIPQIERAEKLFSLLEARFLHTTGGGLV